MKNKRHSSTLIYKFFPVLLIILTIYTAATPENIFAFVENASAKQTESINQDDFNKKFREGRDLIDREEWAHAAEKFREISEKYPDAKSADAALYWLAFCYKKQNQMQAAGEAIERLIEKFPSSSWAADARVMKMEIFLPRAGTYATAAQKLQNAAAVSGTLSPGAPLTSVYRGATSLNTAQTYTRASELVGILNSTSPARTPLDREDEIKIAAFQSLLAADPKRAIETMNDILKPDSKASETLKQEILRVLRSPRSSGFQAPGLAVAGSEIGKEFVPLVREALIKGMQREQNVKLRKEMVYSLANLADDQSIDFLKKRYAEENDREIKKAIINSFSTSANSFYALNSNPNQTRKTELGVLLEIIRIEKDLELRQTAFNNLQRFPNWATDAQTIEIVGNLYESESDEPFKISVIRMLSAARQTQATRKLLNIARNEKSDKLKLEAIYALRTSKDPEVLKFLEELIK